MNTNIEPDCLCMVTDPDCFGKPVVTIEIVQGPVLICGVMGMPKGKFPLWKISEPISWTDPEGKEHWEPYCPQDLLRRIDTNPDEETIKEKEEVL